MTDLLKTAGPWAIYLFAMAWMLKLLVTDKLTVLQTTLNQLAASIAGHDERIRFLENAHAELLGGLRAKGILDPASSKANRS